MKKILAFDTSASVLSLGLIVGDELFCAPVEDLGMRHSVTLLPAVEKLLAENGILPNELDCIAVCVGPGSFTGIRIGVATAKAIALSLNIPCIAVNSLLLQAYNKLDENGVLSLLDAKHGGFYAAAYDKSGEAILEPCFIQGYADVFDAFPTVVCDQPSAVFDAVSKAGKTWEESRVQLPEKGGFLPLVKKLFEEGAFTSFEALEPLYLRKSQAEEGRP